VLEPRLGAGEHADGFAKVSLALGPTREQAECPQGGVDRAGGPPPPGVNQPARASQTIGGGFGHTPRSRLCGVLDVSARGAFVLRHRLAPNGG
jgi:hypothetical protein